MKKPGFIVCSNGLGLSTAFSVMALWASDTEMPVFTRPAACFRLASVTRFADPS